WSTAFISHLTLSPKIPNGFYIARLPFQAVLIAWAYWYTRNPETQLGASKVTKKLDDSSLVQ
ncbi:MAG: hypothetical protein C4323_22895, partial [Mastigocladus sp. ERB_26_2]